MPTFSVVGRSYKTSVYTITIAGQTITSPYPCKSFLIKAVGQGIRFRSASGDTASDGYIMDDGEVINFDLSLAYPSAANASTVGYFDNPSGNSATLYLVIGY